MKSAVAEATGGWERIVSEVVIEKPSVDDIEGATSSIWAGHRVVDLGLVYQVHIDDDASVTLDLTLTSAACPLTDVIEDQAEAALTGGPKPIVKSLDINWAWMPPWGPDKITDDGREQLRALGFNV